MAINIEPHANLHLTHEQVRGLLPDLRQDLAPKLDSELLDEWVFDECRGVAFVKFPDRQVLVAPCSQGSPRRRATAGDNVAVAMANQLIPQSHYQSERQLDVDQTNESFVIDEQVILKWQLFASAPIGATKERVLRDAQFAFLAQLHAQKWWKHPETGQECLVVSISEFLQHSDDGWTWCVATVNSTQRGDQWISQLANATKRMHEVFLASDGIAVSAVHVASLQRTTGNAMDVIDSFSHAKGFLGTHRKQIAIALREIGGLVGMPASAIHGDYHVGQVLFDGVRMSLIDFDGDPLKSHQENLASQPQAVDIASMLCSFLHVGQIAAKTTDISVVDRWLRITCKTFVGEYFSGAPTNELLDQLGHLMWLHEVREYAYSLKYLPRWAYAPEGALTFLQRQGYGSDWLQ